MAIGGCLQLTRDSCSCTVMAIKRLLAAADAHSWQSNVDSSCVIAAVAQSHPQSES